ERGGGRELDVDPRPVGGLHPPVVERLVPVHGEPEGPGVAVLVAAGVIALHRDDGLGLAEQVLIAVDDLVQVEVEEAHPDTGAAVAVAHGVAAGGALRVRAHAAVELVLVVGGDRAVVAEDPRRGAGARIELHAGRPHEGDPGGDLVPGSGGAGVETVFGAIPRGPAGVLVAVPALAVDGVGPADGRSAERALDVRAESAVRA